jgi:hypothetical protein
MNFQKRYFHFKFVVSHPLLVMGYWRRRVMRSAVLRVAGSALNEVCAEGRGTARSDLERRELLTSTEPPSREEGSNG